MIGIIGAMPEEVEMLLEQMQIIKTDVFSGNKFYVGTIFDTDIVVVKCGEGKVNSAICAQTIALNYSPKFIINIGVAGSLNPKYNINDIVIASRCVQHDYDLTPVGIPNGKIPGLKSVYIECDEKFVEDILEISANIEGLDVYSGVIATGDQFVASNSSKKFITSTFGADAVEMEGASIGQVCELNKIPFGIIRSISDSANAEAPIDFPTFAKRAAMKSSQLLIRYIQKIN